MKIVKTGTKGFEKLIEEILTRGDLDTAQVEGDVKSIIADVRSHGNKALLDYTEKFDGIKLKPSELKIPKRKLKEAKKALPDDDIAIMELAAERIRAFHRHELSGSWTFTDDHGSRLGQKVTALERVGIYVPGGKASYPSTVLMNSMPARVAGVKEIIMVTPPSKDGIDPSVLAAAEIAGVDAVYQVGGAQAIAALAYGTKTIPKVDKIVGPGNIYVATAKRLVFGAVDIDMVAGPSEVLVINDGTGDPASIAADLLSQAEHDELASALLITTSSKMAKEVAAEVEKQLKRFKRRNIARASIDKYGAAIVVKNLEEAAALSNRIAPEHLELAIEDPDGLLPSIRNAGAIFMGDLTPEAVGDYMAGPNHTLPTGGTARFSSPLGVPDFLKRTSILSFSREGIEELGPKVKRFAEMEGLYGHARSVALRVKKKSGKKTKGKN